MGDRSFVELTEKAREAIQVKSREQEKTRFSGEYVNNLIDESEIHQSAYIDGLNRLPPDTDFVQPRRARA